MPFNPKGTVKIEKCEQKFPSETNSDTEYVLRFKMQGMSSALCAAVLGAESAADVELALFRSADEDPEQNSKLMGVDSIKCSTTWHGKHTLKIKGFPSIRVDKVYKFELKPRGFAKCDGAFSIVICNPPQGYFENLSSETDIYLEHDAELFDTED